MLTCRFIIAGYAIEKLVTRASLFTKTSIEVCKHNKFGYSYSILYQLYIAVKVLENIKYLTLAVYCSSGECMGTTNILILATLIVSGNYMYS